MLLGLSLFMSFEILAFFAVLTAFVCYDEPIGAGIFIVAAIVFGYFINGLDLYGLFQWITSHELTVFLAIVGYIACGIVWSVVKWQIKLVDLNKIANKLLASGKYNTPADFVNRFYLETRFDYPIEAMNSKIHIVTWMTYWWISIPVTIFGDWFIRLWNNIYALLSNFYQRMADRQFKDINAKLEQMKSVDTKKGQW